MKRFGHKQPSLQPIVLAGLVFVVGILALAGCGKANTVVPAANGANQPDLANLTHNLHKWIFDHRQTPTNFDEFAATAGITIPPPPPGEKYFITKQMTVELVDK